MAGKSASSTILPLHRSLSVQLVSVFRYARLIAFILCNSGVQVLFGIILNKTFMLCML